MRVSWLALWAEVTTPGSDDVVGAASNLQHEPARIAGAAPGVGARSQEAHSSAGAEGSMRQTVPPAARGAAWTATKARRSAALVRRRTMDRFLGCM
jgi:hypothetical protein